MARLLVTPVSCRSNNFAIPSPLSQHNSLTFLPCCLDNFLDTASTALASIPYHRPIRSCHSQPTMEQEQASTAPSGQNSAQNPPPTPSSSSISPLEEDIATNRNNNKNNSSNNPNSKAERKLIAETSPVALPILGGDKPIPTATANDDDGDSANPSPWTNLSRHPVTDEMVFGPIPDREYHERFMRKAIEMAQLALDSDETPVGCVFVRDGEVIGRGINGTNASLNVSVIFFF